MSVPWAVIRMCACVRACVRVCVSCFLTKLCVCIAKRSIEMSIQEAVVELGRDSCPVFPSTPPP